MCCIAKSKVTGTLLYQSQVCVHVLWHVIGSANGVTSVLGRLRLRALPSESTKLFATTTSVSLFHKHPRARHRPLYIFLTIVHDSIPPIACSVYPRLHPRAPILKGLHLPSYRTFAKPCSKRLYDHSSPSAVSSAPHVLCRRDQYLNTNQFQHSCRTAQIHLDLLHRVAS